MERPCTHPLPEQSARLRSALALERLGGVLHSLFFSQAVLDVICGFRIALEHGWCDDEVHPLSGRVRQVRPHGARSAVVAPVLDARALPAAKDGLRMFFHVGRVELALAAGGVQAILHAAAAHAGELMLPKHDHVVHFLYLSPLFVLRTLLNIVTVPWTHHRE